MIISIVTPPQLTDVQARLEGNIRLLDNDIQRLDQQINLSNNRLLVVPPPGYVDCTLETAQQAISRKRWARARLWLNQILLWLVVLFTRIWQASVYLVGFTIALGSAVEAIPKIIAFVRSL